MWRSAKVFAGSLKAKLLAGLTLSLVISILALLLVARNLDDLRETVVQYGGNALPELIDGFGMERAVAGLSLEVTGLLLAEQPETFEARLAAIEIYRRVLQPAVSALSDTDPRRALLEELLMRVELMAGLVRQRLALHQAWLDQGVEIAALWYRISAIINPNITGLSNARAHERSVLLLLDVKSQIQEAISYLRLVTLTEPERVDILRERALGNLARVRYRMSLLPNDATHEALLQEIERLEVITNEDGNPFVSRRRSLLVEHNIDRFSEEIAVLITRLQNLSQDKNDSLSRELAVEARRSSALAERTLFILAVMAAFSTALLAGLAFWLVGPLVGRRVSALTSALRRISAGQLDTPVQVGGEDELVELARGVEMLRRSLVRQQRFQRELALERQRADDLAHESKLVLEEARSRQHFLATMSHEVRTPLNGVIGLLDLCLDATSDPQQRDYLRTAQSAANQLLTVVNDLLEFSRLESGGISLEQLPVDIDAMAADFKRFFDQVRKPSVEFELSIAASVPRPFVGDPTRIQQILHNLLSNAFKFTYQGKVGLTVECTADGDWLLFEVSDTGIGMDPEKQAQVFDPYRQADNSITRRFGGTGLGLAIARHLATVMGGRIELDSVMGQGSRFRVYLPLGQSSAIESLPTKETTQGALSPLGYSVLVAEDNVTNQMVVRAMLERLGCTVVLVENGREALQAYQSDPGRFDLVLMDCEMPELDGYAATRALRQFEASQGLPRRPVLGLSAHALEEYRHAALAAGMDDYLTKPINLAQLAQGLRQWCSAPLDAGKHSASPRNGAGGDIS